MEELSILDEKVNVVSNVIVVMSGKGGVGKSSVSAMLASSLAKQDLRVGILDADITGPSIPKMFGISGRAVMENSKIFPLQGDLGIKIMSLNLLLDNVEQPVIWRGPMIAGTVKQFWTDVAWGELDYLIVDLPPGTGDVPLTVLQSLPVDGVVIVSSPQDLALMIVKKALNMVKQIGTPVIGLVENMSYLECPDCNKRINIFGESKLKDISEELSIPVLGVLPLDPKIAELADQGKIVNYTTNIFGEVPTLVKEINQGSGVKRYKIALPEDNGQVNQHFGQSTSFAIITIGGHQVLETELLSAEGLAHQHEGLAGLLKAQGVEAVVAGGIGSGALEALEQSDIKVFTGVTGSIDTVANMYAKGQLVSRNVSCNHAGCGGGHDQKGHGGCSSCH